MIDVISIYDSGKLFDGRYRLLNALSTAGGSADVWLALDTRISEDESESRAKVAIKIYRPKNLIDIEGEFQFRNEFKKVCNCHHVNIIQPTYFSICEEMPYLVLPYCPAGSSELLIGQFSKGEDLWKYIFEVASGLNYLHEHDPQIIHQDIKPANVLIDDNGNYAITDFGISAELGDDDNDDNGGTYAYMAPERFKENTPPMPESDIWAFGATLYELITGDAPFSNDGGSKLSKSTPIPAIKQNVPEEIKKLIYACLSYDPAHRPSAKDIVETVLKKRYSKNKKLIIAACSLLVAVGITLGIFLSGKSAPTVNPDAEFNTMTMKGDSIFNLEYTTLASNSGVPNDSSISELKKSLVFYGNAVHESVSDPTQKEMVEHRIKDVKLLIDAIQKYDTISGWAEMARRNDLDDIYSQHAMEQELQRQIIDNLLKTIKK